MIPLLAVLVVVSCVASLVTALLVVFAVRDLRLALHEQRQTLLLAQHAARHAPPPPPTPRKRTTSRAHPVPLPYGAHHPTPDPAHPHASPFRGDTWAQGSPAPKDPDA